jgi:hypothetical protein
MGESQARAESQLAEATTRQGLTLVHCSDQSETLSVTETLKSLSISHKG